ncbi:uncharacterized protein LOC133804919 [Humulus lupulus]|uniref:uncharacterized protein LOC133804919 n=1 Tax=Humulus lupulus TaxID=3486 RepID=UPI002B40E705|nr:uncharacterized protein LOC133804919 [Humulus lupulus]
MESRVTLLASMPNADKSVKNLVNEAKLRLVGLWGSQSATNEPSVAMFKPAWNMNRNQSSNLRRLLGGGQLGLRSGNLPSPPPPRAKEPSVPKGKGKQKAVDLTELFDDSSDVNGMDSGDVFTHYEAAAASSVLKKDSKRARGESSKTPLKKARTEDTPTAVPSKENMTPSPPTEQSTPTPVNPQPSSRAADKETFDNLSEGSLSSLVVGSARERIYKLSKHRRSQAAINETASMEVDQIINRGLNEIVTGCCL